MAMLSPSHCYVDGHLMETGEPGITALIEERVVGRLCEDEAINEERLRQFAAAVLAQVEPARMSTVRWTIEVQPARRPHLDASANRVFSSLISRHCGDSLALHAAAIRGLSMVPDGGAALADLGGV